MSKSPLNEKDRIDVGDAKKMKRLTIVILHTMSNHGTFSAAGFKCHPSRRQPLFIVDEETEQGFRT